MMPVLGFAQDKVVSGVVTDAATGKPLAGVAVRAFGNNRLSTMTDAQGHYEIKLPDYVNSVTLSVEGYKLIQKNIGRDAANTNVQLYADGFSATYSTTMTGAQSHTAGGFDQTGDLSIDPQIAEHLGAEIRTINRSGSIASGNMMLINGINSLNANAQPLVVVDGVMLDMQYNRTMLHDGFYNNLLANINVNDIENVTVLKNGTALYGPKAANGVIIIDTKRKKSMTTKIDVNINGAYELQPRIPSVMGSEDYRLYATELVSNQVANVASLGFVNNDPKYYYYNQYHNNTDWKKETYRNAFIQNYGINVQGGDDVANYSLSVGYGLGNSTLKGNDYSRFNMRLNSDISLTNRLNIRFDASYSDIDRALLNDGATLLDTNRAKDDILQTSTGFLALIKSPFLSPFAFDLNGNISQYYAEADNYVSDVLDGGAGSLPNPAAILYYGDGKNRNHFGNRMVQFTVEPSYDFNRHLRLSSLFNLSLVNTNENSYLPILGMPLYHVKGLGENALVRSSSRSLAASQTSITSDTRLAWNHRYDAHNVSLYGGFRFISHNYSLTSQTGYRREGDDKLPNMNAGLMYKSTNGADDKSRDINIYAVGDYSYADKYYLTLGVSSEASSRFGKDADALSLFGVKWGLFPSVNAAWVATNEKWLSGIKGLDYLRFNLGFDVTGNDDVNYTASRTYFVANSMLGNHVDGLSIGNIGNSTLKWETTRRITAGLESNLFNNRVNVRFNYYKSWTSNLLALTQLAWTSGLAENWANDGKLQNEGFDASFNVKLLALKNLQWEAGASAGHYVNKVTALPDNKSFTTNVYNANILTAVGQPVGLFYGHKFEGVFSTTAEANAADLGIIADNGDKISFKAGDAKYQDVNGDKIIDDNDLQVIGDPTPDIYGNIFTNLKWKNWNFSATFNYSLGNDVFNYQRMVLENGSRFHNQTTAMNGRWKNEGQVTSIPRVSYEDPMGNSRFSNRWIEDGSYLRLADVTLGYHIDINSTYLQGITIWGSAANLFTITRYLGNDPETSVSSSIFALGVDRGLLARGRQFSLGVKIEL